MLSSSKSTSEFLSFVNKEKHQIKILHRYLKGMGYGKLMISNDVNGPVYYRVDTKNGEYTKKRICKREHVIYYLAHKRFVEELLRRKENNMLQYEAIISSLASDDAHSIVTSFPKGFELLDFDRIVDPASDKIDWPNPSRSPDVKPEPVRLVVDDCSPEEWAAQPYCENTKDLKNKTHRTSRGLLCRSKGEVSVLDTVDNLGYRFRYDSVILIDGMEISPDLIIIRPDGRLIFVEHHGWITEGNGDSAFLSKLWLYSKAGIVQGRNLLVTFDKPDGSADIELIRHQLKNMVECA